jgi:uncharacterized protein with WD repeat
MASAARWVYLEGYAKRFDWTELKQKLARGDKLEVTQMQKIEAENDIRKELAVLESAGTA